MTAQNIRIGPVHEARTAIDILRVADFEILAGTEEVGIRYLEPEGIGATAAAEVNAGLQRPDVVRDDLDVDDTVVVGRLGG